MPLSNGKIGRKADMLYFIAPVILAILKCPCHKGMAALVSMDVYHIQREHWSDNVTWSKLIPTTGRSSELGDALSGQGIMTLFQKSADPEKCRQMS